MPVSEMTVSKPELAATPYTREKGGYVDGQRTEGAVDVGPRWGSEQRLLRPRRAMECESTCLNVIGRRIVLALHAFLDIGHG